MEEDELYNQIKEKYGITPERFNVLEEQIDIGIQVEYFEFSRKNRESVRLDKVIKEKYKLFLPHIPINEKKLILSQLAGVEDVEAYRIIEKYAQEPDADLKEWSILALQESKMMLESSLLDESQVFISTGLGGKGTKLRYFAVLTSRNDSSFTKIQKKIIQNEFLFSLKNNNSELEEISYDKNICTLIVLIPLSISLKSVFKTAVAECNQMGEFLKDEFIITNVKKLSLQEVRDYLEERKLKGKKLNGEN